MPVRRGSELTQRVSPHRSPHLAAAMGAAPSTPRDGGSGPLETAEHLIGMFVGEKSFPLGSDFWQKLLELPQDLLWPAERVKEACELFGEYVPLIFDPSFVIFIDQVSLFLTDACTFHLQCGFSICNSKIGNVE